MLARSTSPHCGPEPSVPPRFAAGPSEVADVSALIPIIIIVPLALGTQFVLASRYDWQCGNCGHTFSLSPFAAALMPHRPIGQKLARCPNCGTVSWVSRVPKQ